MVFFVSSTAVLSACGTERPGQSSEGDGYDLVVKNGRVIDPASGLDAVRHVGVSDGRIAAVTEVQIEGAETLDASGQIVTAGFIDLHDHGQDAENYRARALDGVTSSFELERGTAGVAEWYARREGETLINFGVSVGHIPARMRAMGDSGAFFPRDRAATEEASEETIEDILEIIETGLREGAVAVGMGLQYTPGASRREALEVFRSASAHGASVAVHLRYMGEKELKNSYTALQEVLANAVVTGTGLHIFHIHSSGLSATPTLLGMIEDARSQSLKVTTEVYPYTAGMTALESAIFDEGWQEILGIGYSDLEWPATGERLTPETFARYRQTDGWVVIHFVPEEAMIEAVKSPVTLFASDGRLVAGKGHPRSSGTFARVLAEFVREKEELSWMEALRKMTIMPARVLEDRVPAMARKGRLQVGADADIVVFDPDAVQDRATYQHPDRPSAGFRHVLVKGVSVVMDGEVVPDVAPGMPLRAHSAR